MNLQHELIQAGVIEDPESFRSLVLRLFLSWHSEWTVEDLLIRPSESAKFVGAIRKQLGGKKVASEVILGTLLNLRKKGSAPKHRLGPRRKLTTATT